jgi:transcription elongation factor GreA
MLAGAVYIGGICESGDQRMSTENRVLLTVEGYERIEKELDRLRTTGRREVAERIRDSKQFGDFAENAEFEEAKIEQAFVEGRIHDLQRVLQASQVVETDSIPTDTIGIGSVVTVIDQDSKDEWQFQLVGSVESDPDNDRISDESPVGEALFGKKVGDKVTVRIPDGRIRYKVASISK